MSFTCNVVVVVGTAGEEVEEGLEDFSACPELS